MSNDPEEYLTINENGLFDNPEHCICEKARIAFVQKHNELENKYDSPQSILYSSVMHAVNSVSQLAGCWQDLAEDLSAYACEMFGYEPAMVSQILKTIDERERRDARDLLSRSYVFEAGTCSFVHIASGARLSLDAFDLEFGSLLDNPSSSIGRELCFQGKIIKVQRVHVDKKVASHLFIDDGRLCLSITPCTCLEDPMPVTFHLRAYQLKAAA